MKTPVKPYLFLIDDGTRYEKQDLLRFLQGRLPFRIVTHDERTYKELHKEYDVERLSVRSVKNTWMYYPGMFFAAELPTNNIRYRRSIRFHTGSWRIRLAMLIRRLAIWLVGHRWRYGDVLRRFYRGSRVHHKLLLESAGIIFTPVSTQDYRIVYEAHEIGIPVICWVYSWDNPMKENEFYRDADLYIVWSEQGAAELERLHGIARDRICFSGPVQFDYLRKFQAAGFVQSETKQFLYACALYRPFHVRQETAFIRLISGYLAEMDTEAILAVRPYPIQFESFAEESEKALREGIIGLSNVRLLEYGRKEKGSRIVGAHDLHEKLMQIACSRCLINLGSTIGLEAAYTETPIIQIGFNLKNCLPSWQDLRQVLLNDHLQPVLEDKYPNVVFSREALYAALHDILRGNAAPYMDYSAYLRSFTRLAGDKSCKESWLKCIMENMSCREQSAVSQSYGMHFPQFSSPDRKRQPHE